jgi:hypothetical protein
MTILKHVLYVKDWVPTSLWRWKSDDILLSLEPLFKCPCIQSNASGKSGSSAAFISVSSLLALPDGKLQNAARTLSLSMHAAYKKA